MNFFIEEEKKEYCREVISFAKEHLNNPDHMNTFSHELWGKVCDFGILGLVIGEEYGGLGESYLTAALVFESLGYACKNNGITFSINNHIWVSMNLIYLYGSKVLKDKYVKDMVDGKRIGAIAITEADAGSDAMAISTYAKEADGGYLLNGRKMFVSNGPIADIFVVFANTSKNNGKELTAFIVEKRFKGVKIGKNIEMMGLEACPASEVIFDQVVVPKENILGHLKGGNLILLQALEWERCYEFAPHIGCMKRIMEMCTQYAEERIQFGKSINENQAVTHKIADMKIAIEMSRLMLYKIAWMKDSGKRAFYDTSIFKVYVSEQYVKVCRDAMQIMGAYGYCKEYGIESELRDALASTIYSGTNEMQRNSIFNF